MLRVTVMGTGNMGRALAGRLLDAGHEVTVWNRTPGRAADLLQRGAAESTDARAAVDGAEVVLSSLTDDAAVRSVLLPGGAPLPVHPTAVVAECSTVSPAVPRELAAAYEGRVVASPVLGAPAAVTGGTATLVLGGPAGEIDRLGSLWGALAGRVLRVGDDPGAAAVAKLLVNYLLLGGLVTLSEAVVAGQAAGLDDDLLTGLLGAVVAPILSNRLDDVVRGDHQGWFAAVNGGKDVRLFVEMATASGVEPPVAAAVAGRYAEAARRGLGELDVAAVVELLRG